MCIRSAVTTPNVTEEKQQQYWGKRKRCNNAKVTCQRFVSVSSLVLAVLIFILACLHLNYLFEAFVRKKSIENLIDRGDSLDSHKSFLWCLLYSFGETNQARSENTHAYDLGVWKLSGLVSAYTLAIAVNLGLFVASTCHSSIVNVTALFIPWIVINFVAILGFLSLCLGIIIVHLAYNSNETEQDIIVDSSIYSSLVPLILALALLTYWIIVVRVYLARIRLDKENLQVSSLENESDAIDCGISRSRKSSLKKSTTKSQNGNLEEDEEQMSLLKTHSLKKDKKHQEPGVEKDSQCLNNFCSGCGSCYKQHKERQKQRASKVNENTNINDDIREKNLTCQQKIWDSFEVRNSNEDKKVSPILTNEERNKINETKKEKLSDSFSSRSPFLPELRHDRRKIKKNNSTGNCFVSQKTSNEEATTTSTTGTPSSSPSKTTCVINGSHSTNEIDDCYSPRRPLSNAEEVDLWTEYEEDRMTSSLGRKKKSETKTEPVRRFSRRRQRARRFSCESGNELSAKTRSVHFKELEQGYGIDDNKRTFILERTGNRKPPMYPKRSKSSHGRENLEHWKLHDTTDEDEEDQDLIWSQRKTPKALKCTIYSTPTPTTSPKTTQT